MFLSLPPIAACEGGAVRFIDGTSGSYDSYDNTRIETLSGSLQICVDGEYRYVCGLSNASFSASDIVAAACIQLGYVSKLLLFEKWSHIHSKFYT